MSIVYKNKTTGQAWGKRFVVDKYILDKTYKYLDENTELLFISAHPEPSVELQFVTTPKQKEKKLLYPLKKIPVKGAHTRGIRLAIPK